jgi:hypothetical protein
MAGVCHAASVSAIVFQAAIAAATVARRAVRERPHAEQQRRKMATPRLGKADEIAGMVALLTVPEGEKCRSGPSRCCETVLQHRLQNL